MKVFVISCITTSTDHQIYHNSLLEICQSEEVANKIIEQMAEERLNYHIQYDQSAHIFIDSNGNTCVHTSKKIYHYTIKPWNVI